jgi:DNA-binding beta-propeller fold protein YncE
MTTFVPRQTHARARSGSTHVWASALLVAAGASLHASTTLIAAIDPPRITAGGHSVVTASPTILSNDGGVTILKLDLAEASKQLASPHDRIRVEHFPIGPGRHATLILEPFSPISVRTQFVIASQGMPDREIAFDTSLIEMYQGTVEGFAGSSVFLSTSPHGSTGRIDLGASQAGSFSRLLLSGKDTQGHDLAPSMGTGVYSLFEPMSRGGVSLDVPLCSMHVDDAHPAPPPPPHPGDDRESTPRDTISRGRLQLQLAVDTDYEFYELYMNQDAALTYLAQLYGQVSHAFMRDVNVRVDLTYVRLWTTHTDPYTSEDPLSTFRELWNTQMGQVPRDAAQLLLGSRRLNAGGVAYSPALCNSSAYSWSGYTLGYFSDPTQPDWTNRDIMIAAHELGHNAGTLHTHDYDLDNCDNALSHPQRGSIMSYCGQTYSGGDANHDLWFHEYTAARIRDYVKTRTCLAPDCNGNGLADSLDISSGTSIDSNANGIPDECEDCNANGILDPIDIATGTSKDVDANGVCDECQPDCNANGIPDTHEIKLAPNLDFNANRILDVCETDVDQNGVSDYRQIHTDMTLDIDRDLNLDAYEDCNANQVPDLADLDHAWSVYVATSSSAGTVREFHRNTGVLMNVSPGSPAAGAQDLFITHDRRIIVSTGDTNSVVELAPDGSLVRTLVAPGQNGLDNAGGMLLLADRGSFLVASTDRNEVLEFSLATGSFIRVAVAANTGISRPFGLALKGGKLYVGSLSSNTIREYDFVSGAFIRTFVPSGTLTDPRGMLFHPNGNLLVASRGSHRINEYDGTTGAFIRLWNRNGTSNRLTLDEPWCMRIGPDGDLYVSRNKVAREGHHDEGGDDTHAHDHTDHYYGGPTSLHLTDARVYQFDIANGNMVRAYILGSDTGLYRPTGFDFMPGTLTDCNANGIPDSCDITSGTSLDLDHNGRPDECTRCTADFDLTGFVDTDDHDAFIAAFISGLDSADIDQSGSVDTDDYDAFILAFETGC